MQRNTVYTINYIFPIIVSFINSSDQQLMRKITGVAIHFRKNPQQRRPPSIFWQPIIIIRMQWEAAALILFICGSIVYLYIQQYRNDKSCRIFSHYAYIYWRRTKVETTGATLSLRDFDFETFLDIFRLRDQKTCGAMAPVAPASLAPLHI